MSDTNATVPEVFAQATAAQQRGDADRAAALYDKVLVAVPDHAEALQRLGALRQRQGRAAEALELLDRLIALRPADAGAHVARGNGLKALGRFEEAVASYDRALALRPELLDALNNQALAQQQLGRFVAAMATFDRALELAPDNATLRFNRAYLLLLLGRFAEGWREYEWRRRRPGWPEPTFRKPEWRGEDLAGKCIFLHAEQAFGDTIQFARFAGSVNRLGAAVVLGVPGGLDALLRRLDSSPVIVPPGDRLPAFDFHLPLMSVPNVIGYVPDSDAAATPYLSADPGLVARWAGRLPRARLRVGIAWHGSALAPDSGKHIPLGAFEPLARLPGVRLVSLQKGAGTEQLGAVPWAAMVETLETGFDSGPDLFVDTAAVMMSLDLVIAPDTAVAHLAGALGRPVWVALRDVPEWRWMLDREDSPWYPSARLFRQRRAGEWDDVFGRIAAALARCEFRESRA